MRYFNEKVFSLFKIHFQCNAVNDGDEKKNSLAFFSAIVFQFFFSKVYEVIRFAIKNNFPLTLLKEGWGCCCMQAVSVAQVVHAPPPVRPQHVQAGLHCVASNCLALDKFNVSK